VGVAPLAVADDLLYVVEDGAIVFTNTPRGDARPVPGFERQIGASAAALPATIYDAYIDRLAREEGLAPELIKAVALVESGLDPHAVSPKGAEGLMQLMPATAAQYGVSDSFDPLENLRAGARHLRSLLDEFGGDQTLALAAYNAGSGAVRRYRGVPAYEETRTYVNKVQERLGRGRRPTPVDPVESEVKLTRTEDGTVLLAN
jgi:soluble lytic murein transglycosylase-like protein